MRPSKLFDWAFDEARSSIVGGCLSLIFPGGIGVAFLALWDQFKTLDITTQFVWLSAAPSLAIAGAFILFLVFSEISGMWRRRSYVRAIEVSAELGRLNHELLIGDYFKKQSDADHPINQAVALLKDFNPLWASELAALSTGRSDQIRETQGSMLKEFQRRISATFGVFMQ